MRADTKQAICYPVGRMAQINPIEIELIVFTKVS